jgi:hypothetical protein
MMIKENSHYRRSRPCGIRTKNGGQLRDLVSNWSAATTICESLRMVRVQWQVEAGFVTAKLNMMEG